jgi:hypothetical protein
MRVVCVGSGFLLLEQLLDAGLRWRVFDFDLRVRRSRGDVVFKLVDLAVVWRGPEHEHIWFREPWQLLVRVELRLLAALQLWLVVSDAIASLVVCVTSETAN